MKNTLIVAIMLSCHVGLSQQNETIVVNPVKQNEQEVLSRMYQYTQFITGKAIYENGDVVTSQLNYNYIQNQIFFIAPKGDTLQLINGADFKMIVIDLDTFYYYNKQFIQQVSHYPTYNVLKKRTLQNSGTEKKGAYGTYSSSSAITNVTTIPEGANANIHFLSDENISYSFKETFFLSGKYGKYYPATKKGANELFGKNDQELKDYLAKNSIDFGKKEDLEKLMVFAQTILK